MPLPIQRSIPTINHTSIADPQRVTWVNDAYNYLHPKIVNVAVLAKNYMYIGLNRGTTFLLRHKTFVIAGVVIGAALLIIHNYLKNRPQKPIVTIESTANLAKLTIHALTEKPLPVNATLTFCVDLSSSMTEHGRAEAVKKAIHDTLNSAEKVINNGPSDANIEIAIVGFNDKATVIAKNFKLLRTQENKSNATEIESVKDKINKLIFSGGTEIIAGLTEATSQLESMAKRNKKGSHTLILLTDGEESLQEKALTSIHEKLASNNATLFAIGIGRTHNEKTLTTIINSNQVGFQGIYIDTTKKETIATAVSKAYTQAISSFNDLVLTAPNLLPGTGLLSIQK